jgi:hypothetical protein
MNLRHAMLGNAMFSGICGTAFLLFSSQLAGFLKVAEVLLVVIGLGLLGFVGLLLFGLFSQHTRKVGVLAVWLDWVWVLGSFPAFVLLENGRLAVLAVALVVAGFAHWQQKGVQAWHNI